MHYIIIGILVIGVIITLGKYILFEPRVNSIISIIYFLWFAITELKVGDWFPIILISIAMIDCVRDIIIAKDYYADIEIEIDKMYKIKSLSSIFTGGLVRIIFLLIVEPYLSFSVSSDIKKRMEQGYPLPYSSDYSSLQAKNYYYEKRILELVEKGELISNIKTVDSESKVQRKKLDDLYPEKILDKIVDMIAGDKDMKENRKRAERRLQINSIKKNYAYLRTDMFDMYAKLISEVMANKGCYSVLDIKKFEELKELNLMMPIVDNYNEKNSTWSNYFIIQALQPLVVDGVFSDSDFNDNDVFDNHAYQYVKSTVMMPSIDADNEPRLALDD